jgi:hypothetical protein
MHRQGLNERGIAAKVFITLDQRILTRKSGQPIEAHQVKTSHVRRFERVVEVWLRLLPLA